MNKCSVDDCNNQIKIKELCGMHYSRLIKYGRLHRVHVEIDKTANCIAPECQRKQKTRKLCDMHYKRLHTKGTLEARIRKLRILNSSGYIYFFCPKHPSADSNGYVLEHRIVMEAHVGRYLESREAVHHINGRKNDNRIENLQLLTRSEHQRLHMNFRKSNRLITMG